MRSNGLERLPPFRPGRFVAPIECSAGRNLGRYQSEAESAVRNQPLIAVAEIVPDDVHRLGRDRISDRYMMLEVGQTSEEPLDHVVQAVSARDFVVIAEVEVKPHSFTRVTVRSLLNPACDNRRSRSRRPRLRPRSEERRVGKES